MIPNDCENPTTLQTNCKICKYPMTVTVPKGYLDLGDPLKLLPMATCNTCFDLRETGARLYSRILHICVDTKSLMLSKKRDRADIEKLLKACLDLAAAFSNWMPKMKARSKEFSMLYPRKRYAPVAVWPNILERQHDALHDMLTGGPAPRAASPNLPGVR